MDRPTTKQCCRWNGRSLSVNPLGRPALSQQLLQHPLPSHAERLARWPTRRLKHPNIPPTE
eukprot:7920807-Lingulodinium_polyedra.AAC.1